MECVILMRIGGQIMGLADRKSFGSIAVFPDYDAALTAAEKHSVASKVGYQIVELDEL